MEAKLIKKKIIQPIKVPHIKVLLENDDLYIKDGDKNDLENKFDLPNLHTKNNNKKSTTINYKIQNKGINSNFNLNQKDFQKKVTININNNTLANSSRVKISNTINIERR